jgi:xanthine dehydrogenase small subunit
LKKGELIKQVFFPCPTENLAFNFEKVSRRTYLDIASVNSAAYLEFSDGKIHAAHLSAGGVAPFPLYLEKTSEFLSGKSHSSELIEEAIEISQKEISPISDMRGSAVYKNTLLKQLLKAHFMQIFTYSRSNI